jgi:lysozyme family protein
MTAFDTCYASILKSEGGYVNNPKDPGGMTNLGVTKRAWEAWVGHPVAEGDMRGLTGEKVAPFYRAMYWNPVHGDALPPALALCAFHVSVNAGPKRAAKLLQMIVGAAPDGAIGPGTLAAVTLWICAHSAQAAVTAYQDALRAFYRGLPTFITFGKGWLNRAADVEQQAKAMI